MDLNCKSCGRWLGHNDPGNDVYGLTIKCSNSSCKRDNVFHIFHFDTQYLMGDNISDTTVTADVQKNANAEESEEK